MSDQDISAYVRGYVTAWYRFAHGHNRLSQAEQTTVLVESIADALWGQGRSTDADRARVLAMYNEAYGD